MLLGRMIQVRDTMQRRPLPLLRLAGWSLLGLCAVNGAASASENGGFGSFPVGAQTVAAAFLPPPEATEFYGYLLYYAGHSFRDGAGHAGSPGLEASVFAQAPRMVHTWQYSLGGIHVSSGLVAESDYIKVKAADQRSEDTGLDLVGVEPFDLTAAYGHWRFLSGTHFYLPVGAYDRNAAANASTHYMALAQQFAVTWLPSPRWDLSINPNLEFNMRNMATGYRSGDQFGLTWGISYRPLAGRPNWQLGLSGFYAYQFSDDHLDGAEVPGGFRLRKSAVGPQLMYWFSPAAVVQLKWQHETAVRNAPRGELCWLEFAFPL